MNITKRVTAYLLITVFLSQADFCLAQGQSCLSPNISINLSDFTHVFQLGCVDEISTDELRSVDEEEMADKIHEMYVDHKIGHWWLHIYLVSKVLVELAEEAGFDGDVRNNYLVLAELHDIGKDIVDRQINNSHHLSPEEIRFVDMRHSSRALELIAEAEQRIGREIPFTVKKAILYHHNFPGIASDNELGDPALRERVEIMTALLTCADILSAMCEGRSYQDKGICSEENIITTLRRKGVYEKLVQIYGNDELFLLSVIERQRFIVRELRTKFIAQHPASGISHSDNGMKSLELLKPAHIHSQVIANVFVNEAI